MSDSVASSSVLVISDDTALVGSLVENNKTGQTFIAKDSVQFMIDEPTLLDNNSIVIFDIGTDGNTLEASIDQILKIKQQDPTQVLMVTGEGDALAEALKSSIQPLVYRAFTKPVNPNQVFLAFKSGNKLHSELVVKRAAGIDIDVVGAAENKTTVGSIASERSSNSAVYVAIGAVALAVAGWLLFGGGEDNQVETPVAVVSSEEAVDSESVVPDVSQSVQRINELNQLAETAMLENRIVTPTGDSALDYYDQVLALDAYDSTAYEGKKGIASLLRESYNTLVANAEFDKALNVINVLQRIEPLNVQNDALKDDLEKSIDLHVKKIQQSGTSDEIAETAAVLDKIGAEFAGSKTANDALQAEQKLIVLIDKALDGNVLIPPKKDNAYSLVSDALKSNTVSKANITPRVKTLGNKLLELANNQVANDDLEEATKLAALVKRLNVNKKQVDEINTKIAEAKAAKTVEVSEAEVVEEEVAPEPPKIIPAKIISRAAPKYPKRALNKNIEGWVEIGFDVDSAGEPINVKVISSEPSDVFNSAAIKAVNKWRFSPARNEQTGLPVATNNISTKLQFKLD